MGSEGSVGVLGKEYEEAEEALPADECSCCKVAVAGKPGMGPGLSVMGPRWYKKPFVSLGGGTPLGNARWSKRSESEGRLRWLGGWSSVHIELRRLGLVERSCGLVLKLGDLSKKRSILFLGECREDGKVDGRESSVEGWKELGVPTAN